MLHLEEVSKLLDSYAARIEQRRYSPDSWLLTPDSPLLKRSREKSDIFDFGDWWEFDLKLEKIEPDEKRTDYGAIIESKGLAPEQYPSWEDEDWEEADNYEWLEPHKILS